MKLLPWDNSSAAWGSWTLYGVQPPLSVKYTLGYVARKQVGRVRKFYAQVYLRGMHQYGDGVAFDKLSEAKGWVVALVTLETEDG